MGARPGPPPLPTKEHKLRGNPSFKKLNENEPEPVEVYELPPPPEHLGEYAAHEWNRIGPELIRIKLLTEADLESFSAYCMNVEIMVEAYKAIKAKGMVIMGSRGPIRNPALPAFGQASTAVKAFAQEFGLTPSARSRISIPDKSEKSLDELIGAVEADDFDQGLD